MKINKMKLAFLPLLIVITAITTSCESENEDIQVQETNLENSQASNLTIRNNPTQIVNVQSGEEVIINVGWGDEEEARLATEPKNAVTSKLTAPGNYTYQSEDGFTGTEVILVQAFDPVIGFAGFITFTSIVINVVESEEVPQVGIFF